MHPRRSLLHRPIPQEFLRAPSASPNTVSIVVDHARARPCLDGVNCSFWPSAAATPVVDTAAKADGTTSVVAGDTITLTGSRFGADTAAVRVDIGGAACVPTQVSDAQVVCTVGSGGAAGLHVVRLGVASLGDARLSNPASATLTLSVLQLTSFAPVAVSPASLTRLVLTGSGFNAADCAAHTITAVDPTSSHAVAVCAVEACTATTLTCFMDGTALQDGSIYNLAVTMTGTDASADPMLGFETRRRLLGWSQTETFPAQLSASTAQPSVGPVTGIALTAASGSATDLSAGRSSPTLPGAPTTLTATVADASSADAISSPRLVPVAGSPADVPAYDLTITGSADNGNGTFTLTLPAPAMMVGTYSLEVTVASGTGAVVVRAAQTVHVAIEVSSVTPATGTLAGLTKVTVSGWGFAVNGASADGLTSVVMVRVPVSTTFPSGEVECDLVEAESSFTQLVCLTRCEWMLGR